MNRLAAALRVLSLGISLAARGTNDKHRTSTSLQPNHFFRFMPRSALQSAAMPRSFSAAVLRALPWICLPAWAASGCQAQVVNPPAPHPGSLTKPTHRGVAPPPSVKTSIIWVALADHLGAGTLVDRSAPLLTLISAGTAPLQLQGRGGELLLSAETLRFSWRRMPLQEPLDVARRVAGPFASFESADRIAERWRDGG